MEKTLALILVILLYTCSYGQETFYTSGQGSGAWNDPQSWMLTENGPLADRIPTPASHIVIRHSITQNLEAEYVHKGNIEVQKGKTYEIMGSGDYSYVGDLFELRGNLISAVNFHHRSLDTDVSNLIIRNTALFYALDDMHIADGAEFLSEQGVCAAINIYGSLNFHGSRNRILGHAKIICGEIIVYDDLGREIQSGGEKVSYVSRQMGNQVQIFTSEADCEGGNTLVSGKGGHMAKINLINFEAIQKDHSVEVSLQTSSLLSLPDLKLERSWGGQNFEAIEEIAAYELNERGGHYRAEDVENLQADRQYRLSYTNEGGETIVLGLIETSAQARINAYPNPYQGEALFIQAIGFEANTALSIKILDLQGKKLWESQTRSDKEGKIEYQTQPHLQRGSYLISVESEQQRKSQRLMVF